MISSRAMAFSDVAAELVAVLKGRGWTLATAESLTAGLLSATVADVPGASAVLRGGVVVYATDLKHELAGVPPEVLERHGAVSAETARALASGAASRCGADVGLGLTGVAGPDEQEGQPVGTVHVGLCVPGRAVWSHRLELTGDRRRIREGACRAAMDILLDVARVPGEATSGDGSAPGQAR